MPDTGQSLKLGKPSHGSGYAQLQTAKKQLHHPVKARTNENTHETWHETNLRATLVLIEPLNLVGGPLTFQFDA